jgi:hypothetical protein
MLENLKKYKIKLASNSPRRRELLSGLGIDYEVKLYLIFFQVFEHNCLFLYYQPKASSCDIHLPCARKTCSTTSRPHP